MSTPQALDGDEERAGGLIQILGALQIDGRALACEHAVLISEGGIDESAGWVVSLLGVRPVDYERIGASCSFRATGVDGARYSGRVAAAAGCSPWHVRLEGQGALRAHRGIEAPRDDAGGDAESLELPARHNERTLPLDLKWD